MKGTEQVSDARKLSGDMTAAVQYLKRAYRKDGDRLFSRACSDRTRGDGFKMKEGDSYWREGRSVLH